MPDELLDVVSQDDTVIARELRSVVHERGLTHRGVHVFLFTPDGQLLVQQRSRHRDTAPLALDCSVSEHVKSGEDFPLAALRGLEEELGIVQATLSRVAYFEFCYGPNDNKISQLFEGVVHPDSVHIDPQEVERVIYHSLPELLAIRDAKTAQFSLWFEQLLLWYGRRPCQLRILEAHHGRFQPA
jgi:16S rRNA (adenine1518-N6/adenine1519-N6)-dimethyltransferase